MADKFIIPTITPQSLLNTGLQVAAQIATELAGEARNNAPKSNPYTKGIATIQPHASFQTNSPYDGKIASNDPDLPLYASDLGTNVYADVTFDSVTYTDSNNKPIITPSMTLQAILVDVVFPRNIVKTEIQGTDGTVKEYIGEGDAQITFRGVLTGTNGSYPSEDVSTLLKIIKAPVAIPVTCTYLNDKGIYNVVFEDRTLGQTEGGYSYQTFSLPAISDTPQELSMSQK